MAFECANTAFAKLKEPYKEGGGKPAASNNATYSLINDAMAVSSGLRPSSDVFEQHVTLPILPGFFGAFEIEALHDRISTLLDAANMLLSRFDFVEFTGGGVDMGKTDDGCEPVETWVGILTSFREAAGELAYNKDMTDLLRLRGLIE